jgi:hypothetical protein
MYRCHWVAERDETNRRKNNSQGHSKGAHIKHPRNWNYSIRLIGLVCNKSLTLWLNLSVNYNSFLHVSFL